MNEPSAKRPGRPDKPVSVPVPFEEPVSDLLKVKPEGKGNAAKIQKAEKKKRDR